MKIIKALSLTLALLLTFMLSACTGTDTDSKKSAGTADLSSSQTMSQVDSAVSFSASSASVSEAGSASQQSVTESSSKTATDYATTVKKLAAVLSEVDKMGAGGLTMNEVQTIKKGKNEYAKVTDTRFKSTADIDKYMKDSLTENMISARYSGLIGTDEPRFIDDNGTLYEKTGARAGGFTWTSDAPEISDKTDSSFTAKMKYEDFGATSVMIIKVILDNGVWKIDSISI